MSATALASPPRKCLKKPERRVHLSNADGNPKILEMTIGERTYGYFVSVIPAEFGIGFLVRKFLPETDVYHVHYDPVRKLSSCDCKGGEFNRHCKHQEAIVALIKCGKLAVPAMAPVPVLSSPIELEDL